MLIQYSSAVLTSEQAIDYADLLNDCLKQDQLLDAETMTSIQRRLDGRNSLGQSASEAKSPVIELGKFNVEKLLRLRSAPRTELSPTSYRNSDDNKNTTMVTVRLGKRKIFQSPFQPAFSIGRHPIIISLHSPYHESFFCRRSDNSLILSSSTTIDVINRGSGLEVSIRFPKITGTTKDKILAGTWCEHCHRLILNGNYRMYFFDMRTQEQADQFRCQPANGDIYNTPRFLGCTQSSIFYGKSD